MNNYDDINYEINEIFNYITKNSHGKIEKMIKEMLMGKNEVLLIVNIFSRCGFLNKYKKGGESYYSVSKIISPLSFGKAVNIGIDIDNLNLFFGIKTEESINDLTYFISSGELENAIINEEKIRKEEYIEKLKNKCSDEIAELSINNHIENIESIITNDSKTLQLSNEVLNILNEVSKELSEELLNLKDKLISKKIKEVK